MRLNEFVLPFVGNEVEFEASNPNFGVRGCNFQMEPHAQLISVYSNSHATPQETNLFRNFADLVLSGRLDPYWPEIALKTQQVMDGCRLSALGGSSETSLA